VREKEIKKERKKKKKKSEEREMTKFKVFFLMIW
jgi:hypothetical protein